MESLGRSGVESEWRTGWEEVWWEDYSGEGVVGVIMIAGGEGF